MLNKDEILKEKKKLVGYEILLDLERGMRDLTCCVNCQKQMMSEMADFCKKWELISDELYNNLKNCCYEEDCKKSTEPG